MWTPWVASRLGSRLLKRGSSSTKSHIEVRFCMSAEFRPTVTLLPAGTNHQAEAPYVDLFGPRNVEKEFPHGPRLKARCGLAAAIYGLHVLLRKDLLSTPYRVQNTDCRNKRETLELRPSHPANLTQQLLSHLIYSRPRSWPGPHAMPPGLLPPAASKPFNICKASWERQDALLSSLRAVPAAREIPEDRGDNSHIHTHSTYVHTWRECPVHRRRVELAPSVPSQSSSSVRQSVEQEGHCKSQDHNANRQQELVLRLGKETAEAEHHSSHENTAPIGSKSWWTDWERRQQKQNTTERHESTTPPSRQLELVADCEKKTPDGASHSGPEHHRKSREHNATNRKLELVVRLP